MRAEADALILVVREMREPIGQRRRAVLVGLHRAIARELHDGGEDERLLSLRTGGVLGRCLSGRRRGLRSGRAGWRSSARSSRARSCRGRACGGAGRWIRRRRCRRTLRIGGGGERCCRCVLRCSRLASRARCGLSARCGRSRGRSPARGRTRSCRSGALDGRHGRVPRGRFVPCLQRSRVERRNVPPRRRKRQAESAEQIRHVDRRDDCRSDQTSTQEHSWYPIRCAALNGFTSPSRAPPAIFRYGIRLLSPAGDGLSLSRELESGAVSLTAGASARCLRTCHPCHVCSSLAASTASSIAHIGSDRCDSNRFSAAGSRLRARVTRHAPRQGLAQPRAMSVGAGVVPRLSTALRTSHSSAAPRLSRKQTSPPASSASGSPPR